MMERLKKPILSKPSSYATTPDGDDTMDECKKRSPHNLSSSGLGQQQAWGERMGEQMMRNNAENNCSCFAGEDDEEQLVEAEYEHEADPAGFFFSLSESTASFQPVDQEHEHEHEQEAYDDKYTERVVGTRSGAAGRA